MDCAICRHSPIEVGVLCEECRDNLSGPPHLVPEQVQSTTAKPVGAALVDLWGRPHALDARTLLGRHVGGFGVAILDGAISRHHAHLAFDQAAGVWKLRDIGSANGTFLNEQQVTEPTAVRDLDRIGIGQVEFYFVEQGGHLASVPLAPFVSTTLPVGPRSPSIPVVDTSPINEFDREEATGAGMATAAIAILEPTGGGGGVVVVDDHEVQLGQTQFELFKLLYHRMLDERDQPELVRGFVRSSELLGQLPWDARDPSDNNVKQVVRRVRRTLIKAAIGDLIESRHRFGYRLRVVPAPHAS